MQGATEVYNKGLQVLQSVSGIIKCYRLILESTSGDSVTIVRKWDVTLFEEGFVNKFLLEMSVRRISKHNIFENIGTKPKHVCQVFCFSLQKRCTSYQSLVTWFMALLINKIESLARKSSVRITFFVLAGFWNLTCAKHSL